MESSLCLRWGGSRGIRGVIYVRSDSYNGGDYYDFEIPLGFHPFYLRCSSTGILTLSIEKVRSKFAIVASDLMTKQSKRRNF